MLPLGGEGLEGVPGVEQMETERGADQEETNHDFSLASYKPVVKITDSNCSSALVRYISHIKLVYKPNQPLEAKAYPGVRVFGCSPSTPTEMAY